MVQNTGVVLDCLRAANVAVRWLMLHGAAKQLGLADAARSAAPPAADVAALLLDTSLLEYEVGQGSGLSINMYILSKLGFKASSV